MRERPFAEIYRDAPLFRELRDPDLLKGKCGECDFRTVCGGSRARAYGVTSSSARAESDPVCLSVADGDVASSNISFISPAFRSSQPVGFVPRPIWRGT